MGTFLAGRGKQRPQYLSLPELRLASLENCRLHAQEGNEATGAGGTSWQLTYRCVLSHGSPRLNLSPMGSTIAMITTASWLPIKYPSSRMVVRFFGPRSDELLPALRELRALAIGIEEVAVNHRVRFNFPFSSACCIHAQLNAATSSEESLPPFNSTKFPCKFFNRTITQSRRPSDEPFRHPPSREWIVVGQVNGCEAI